MGGGEKFKSNKTEQGSKKSNMMTIGRVGWLDTFGFFFRKEVGVFLHDVSVETSFAPFAARPNAVAQVSPERQFEGEVPRRRNAIFSYPTYTILAKTFWQHKTENLVKIG